MLSLSACSPAEGQGEDKSAQTRHFDRVILVVLENEGRSEALADPYISSLSRESAWFSNYHALAHPSFPNYLALVAGSTYGIESDGVSAPINGSTIVDRLEAKQLTWKSYAEDYPGRCFLGPGAGNGRATPTARPTWLYARKHVPLLAFTSIQRNRARCAKVVNAREFNRDLAAGNLPNFSFYTPNMFNDGHDTSLGASTTWLKRFVDRIRAAPGKERTLLIVTWDEGGEEDEAGNRVLALFIGDVVKPGRYDARANHYSVLRTIEDNFGLEPLNEGDRDTKAVPDNVWR